ncbi:MAG TPA: hypothetical protein VHG69_00525 [Thermoleophilaceae bacterium]|nr:hypothetical protein [Thermoleophilaceae bacterium]
MARRPPPVTLGHVAENGISPSMLALVEHGARKRPALARQMRGQIEIRFKERFAPVRMSFGDDGILVEDADGGGEDPDLVVSGSLPDIVQLASAPLAAGIPKLTDPRGRAAIKRVANRRVRMQGSTRLAGRLLRLLEL